MLLACENVGIPVISLPGSQLATAYVPKAQHRSNAPSDLKAEDGGKRVSEASNQRLEF